MVMNYEDLELGKGILMTLPGGSVTGEVPVDADPLPTCSYSESRKIETVIREHIPHFSWLSEEQKAEVSNAIEAAIHTERTACANVAGRADGRMDCDPYTAKWILDRIVTPETR